MKLRSGTGGAFHRHFAGDLFGPVWRERLLVNLLPNGRHDEKGQEQRQADDDLIGGCALQGQRRRTKESTMMMRVKHVIRG